MDVSVKNKIINRASELFFQFGPSRVTMEEIADKLGMSKKTLYKFFTSKDELLDSVIENSQCQMKCLVYPIIEAALQGDEAHFASTLASLEDEIGAHLNRNADSPFFADLRRHYPELWARFELHRREHIIESMRLVLQQGVERGIFRHDLNYTLCTELYVSAVEYMFNPVMLSRLPLTASDIHKMMISVFFEGILTPKGRAVSPRYSFEHGKTVLGQNGSPNGSANGVKRNAAARDNGERRTDKDERYFESLVEVM